MSAQPRSAQQAVISLPYVVIHVYGLELNQKFIGDVYNKPRARNDAGSDVFIPISGTIWAFSPSL